MMAHNFFSVSTHDRQSCDLFDMLWQTVLSERDDGKDSEFWSAHSLETLHKKLKTKIGSIRRELLSQGIVILNPDGIRKKRFILKEVQEPSEASASPTSTPNKPGTPTMSIAPESMSSQSGSLTSRPNIPSWSATPREPAAPTRSSASIFRVYTESEVIKVLRHFLYAIRTSRDPYPTVSELGEGASQTFQDELIQVCVEATRDEMLPKWNDPEYSKMAELASAAERLGATWDEGTDQRLSFGMDDGEDFLLAEED
jgi:hypothetical protein